MENFEEQIDKYFHDYCTRFNDALEGKEIDVDAVINSFSEKVLESSPVGLMVLNNDEEFKSKIPQSFDFYRSIGTTCMVIDNKEITKLDEHHVMVKVHWKANYEEGKTGQMIGFNIFYFLRNVDSDWKCFAYVTGDEQKVLKDHGLL